ncbi:hypothetical protein LTR94_027732, partial [Friedmanniomyces endolithicus]
ASSVAYRDMDASALGFAKGVTPLLDQPAVIALPCPIPGVPTARLSTGANVVSGAAYDAIDADMVDMETWALVRAAQTIGLPLVALRGVSDGRAELKALEDWTSTLHHVDENLAAALDALIGVLEADDHQKVLIVDFGSQVTQLIARRLREASVYCEIHPFQKAEAALAAMNPAAIILSGGPESVHEEGSPRAPQSVFEAGVPVLGICYGEMTMCEQLGGKVEGGHTREFGRAEIRIEKASPLLADLAPVGEEETVWMSHGDKIVAIPQGFNVVASSEGSPYAVIADETRRFYGVQFHPEVMHTPRGHQMLKNFTHGIAGLKGDWTMA